MALEPQCCCLKVKNLNIVLQSSEPPGVLRIMMPHDYLFILPSQSRAKHIARGRKFPRASLSLPLTPPIISHNFNHYSSCSRRYVSSAHKISTHCAFESRASFLWTRPTSGSRWVVKIPQPGSECVSLVLHESWPMIPALAGLVLRVWGDSSWVWSLALSSRHSHLPWFPLEFWIPTLGRY